MKKENKLNYEFRKHFINPLFADYLEIVEKNSKSELATSNTLLIAQLEIRRQAKKYRFRSLK